MKKQVNKKHYFNFKYINLLRFISYWYQIISILKESPKNVLEIGIGNNITSNILRTLGINIKNVDIDKELEPNYLGSITNLPLKDN
jgi:hypothetical protein